MPAITYRGGLDERDTIISAAANYTRGVPLLEKDVVGIPITSGLAGTKYSRHLTGIHEITTVASAAHGDTVYYTDADGTISRTAGTGKQPIGTILRIPGDEGVASGKMWIRLGINPGATA